VRELHDILPCTTITLNFWWCFIWIFQQANDSNSETNASKQNGELWKVHKTQFTVRQLRYFGKPYLLWLLEWLQIQGQNRYVRVCVLCIGWWHCSTVCWNMDNCWQNVRRRYHRRESVRERSLHTNCNRVCGHFHSILGILWSPQRSSLHVTCCELLLFNSTQYTFLDYWFFFNVNKDKLLVWKY
jgi:hypothetical protein